MTVPRAPSPGASPTDPQQPDTSPPQKHLLQPTKEGDYEWKQEADRLLNSRQSDTFAGIAGCMFLAQHSVYICVAACGGHDHSVDLESGPHPDMSKVETAEHGPSLHSLHPSSSAHHHDHAVTAAEMQLQDTFVYAEMPSLASAEDNIGSLEAQLLSNVQLDKECPKAGSTVNIPGIAYGFENPAVIGRAGEQDATGNMDYVQ